jgi:hypothetical protein
MIRLFSMSKGESRRHGSVVPSPQAVVAAHVLADTVLTTVLPRLEREDIVALPVKGVATARELYADVADRPISDVDLRVVPERFGDVVRVIRQEGWEQLVYARPYRNVVFRLNGLPIDVECAVGPPGLCALPIAAMIARATPDRLRSGVPFLRPELHDHAVLLCVNLFKDKITRAAPWALQDVVRVAARPDFDVDLFVARARQSHVAAITWIVADWMATELGSAAWAVVRDAIGVVPRAYYAGAYRWLRGWDDRSILLRVLARIGSDSRRAQVRALGTMVWWASDRRVRSLGRMRPRAKRSR